MKNFPSALIKQKNTKQGLGDTLNTTLKNIGTQALSNIFGFGKSGNVDISSVNSKFEEGYERLDVQHDIESININNYVEIDKSAMNEINQKIYRNSLASISLMSNMNNGNQYLSNVVQFEDPFLYSSSLFNTINNYKYINTVAIPNISNHIYYDVDQNTYKYQVIHAMTSPSLFNPYNAVNFNYITEGIPLLNESSSGVSGELKNDMENDLPKTGFERQEALTISGMPEGFKQGIDITDCSIKKLVELSNKENSPLGCATYRYIDFMYCKDLGKISNNHLITLRKFGTPIGDNIFQEAVPSASNNSVYKSNYDIGRLVTWFDNEDNKLEDICRYNYGATWKEFRAQIQQLPSQQQDGDSNQLSDGFVNKIANAFSASNNKLVERGFSSNYGLLQWGANKLHIPILNEKTPQKYYDWTVLSNYDQNRIYEPKDTIWDTHKYEGRLEFNQEISLTFRYKLRSYANINPKSAFLDLIGNIMSVTYRRGNFWGGESQIYGPQGNNSIYDTSNVFIDKTFDKLGGIWKMLRDGTLTPNVIMGWLGNIMESIGDVLGTAGNAAMKHIKDAANAAGGNMTTTADEEAAASKAKELLNKGFTWLEDNNNKFGWTNAIKGMFKNQLGRPAIYAFNSLLTGEAVGPWHLTIGNPLNPIMSIGNLILINSEVQHLGPLGLDDFPTEIKVTVQLKHGRPRDSVEIQKMYTRGRDAIYKPMNLLKVDSYKTNPYAFGDVMMISNEKLTTEEATEAVNKYEADQLKSNPNYKKMSESEKNKSINARILEPSALNKLLRTI